MRWARHVRHRGRREHWSGSSRRESDGETRPSRLRCAVGPAARPGRRAARARAARHRLVARRVAAEPITRVLLQPDDGRLCLPCSPSSAGSPGWSSRYRWWRRRRVCSRTERFRLRVPGLGRAPAVRCGVADCGDRAHSNGAGRPCRPHTVTGRHPIERRRVRPQSRFESRRRRGLRTRRTRTAIRRRQRKPRNPGRPTRTRTRATENATKDERSALVHTVKPGDDLWSLAERYYDDGMEWRRIAKANRHVLTGGPDRLEVGWELTIPGAQPTPGGEHRTSDRYGAATPCRRSRNASSATPHAGRSCFAANRSVLDDPDELAVGTTLTIPGKHGGTARARDSAPDRLANGQTAGADGRTGPRTAEPPRTNDSDRRGGTDGPPADQGPTSDVARRTTRSVRPPGPSSSRSAQHDAGAPTPPASADVDAPTQPASSGAEAPTKGTRAGAEEPAQGTGGGAGSPTRTTGPGETTAAAALPTESSPGETTAAQSRPADTSPAATMPTLVDSSDSSSPLADLSAARLASFAGDRWPGGRRRPRWTRVSPSSPAARPTRGPPDQAARRRGPRGGGRTGREPAPTRPPGGRHRGPSDRRALSTHRSTTAPAGPGDASTRTRSTSI